MKSFNWFNDLSSILTQDLATAAVEETEPESMEFLANELGDKVEKLSQISWKEMFGRAQGCCQSRLFSIRTYWATIFFNISFDVPLRSIINLN